MPGNRRPTPWEKWLPPPVDWYKINFNTAIRDSFSVQAAVCRNDEGHIIGMVPQLSSSSSCMPNFGEALSALVVVAVSLATSLNLGRFIIEGEHFPRLEDFFPYL